jgi:hypothetical protein
MKKFIVIMSLAIFTITVYAYAADDAKPELRPAQKIMQARAAQMTAMNKNLGAKKFEAITTDAEALAADTTKVGANQANPLAKDITLAIASYAKEISAAAAKKDDKTIKVKLGDIKGKCNECHVKIRDKK